MSKKFEILGYKPETNYCRTCLYEEKCKLLKYLNSMARQNKAEAFNNRFFCSEYEKEHVTSDGAVQKYGQEFKVE